MDLYLCLYLFCKCNSVRIGQNIQNDASLERSVFAKVVAYQFINFKWKPNGSIEDCMHMHRSIRVVYDRSRLKRVKLRANVRTQQLQTLVGVFGQQCCSRLHRAKSLTMIKIEIHSVYFIQSIQSIDFTAGLTWKYIWIENPDRSQISQECDFLSRHVLAVPSLYLWAHIRYRLFEIRMFSRG